MKDEHFVSKSIRDFEVLSSNPDFEWDWQAISSNELLLSNTLLYTQFGEKLDWNLVLIIIMI